MDKLGPYQLNQIYCGECAAMMAALPDGCIDFWLTSPPYDNQRTYNGYTFDFERIATQLWRVSKPGGVGVWVVADETKDGSESGTSFRQALGFMAVGFNLHDTMIWDKVFTPIPTQDRYYARFEYMFILSKGKPKALNLIEDKINKWAGLTKLKDTCINKDNPSRSSDERHLIKEFSRRSNIWEIPIGYGKMGEELSKHHRAIFPEALARDHIISWSNPGDLVFDPMAGSGTTLKMAHILERQWLGFDISEEYCQLARRRVGEVIREHNKEWKPLNGNGHKIDDLPLFAPQPVEAAT